MHDRHIIDHQLETIETSTQNDTVIFGPTSPEKPNVGKSVQLSEGFLIKQFQSTIWVPNPANPTENSLGSNTSQSETNVSTETPDKPFDSSSASIRPRNPSVCLSGLRQPLSTQCWPCITLNRPVSASEGPASTTLASLKHCATPDCLGMALREPWLLLRHSLWLLRCSLGTILASLSLCTLCPSAATPITDCISRSEPRSREYND